MAKTNKAVLTHKLIVAVKKNVAPAAEKKLAILVLISQDGAARAGAVATPSKPLTVLLDNRGLYRVKAEIDSSCTGSCDASYRIFRLGQPQTRDGPQLSAQGLRLRLQQGHDRQGLLSAGVLVLVAQEFLCGGNVAAHDPGVLADLSSSGEPVLLEQLDRRTEQKPALSLASGGRLGDRLDQTSAGGCDLRERTLQPGTRDSAAAVALVDEYAGDPPTSSRRRVLPVLALELQSEFLGAAVLTPTLR